MSADLVPGVVTTLAPGVRRLVAPNAGVMTGPGTNTYLLGEDDVAVVDPGPEMSQHIDSIIKLSPGVIRWIAVTHTHPDHSPAAGKLAAATGAETIGIAAPPGQHQDPTFRPRRVPGDQELIHFGKLEVRALHTPGHASNHVCYLLTDRRWLLTGDHVIDGSTVVIDPPDGDMAAYLRSLERLMTIGVDAILPGHGRLIENPDDVVRWTIDHRLRREARVAAALRDKPGATCADLVPEVYGDVDPALHGIAERSLLAHLIKLEADSIARLDGDRWTIHPES